jgi:hypothetical protein
MGGLSAEASYDAVDVIDNAGQEFNAKPWCGGHCQAGRADR